MTTLQSTLFSVQSNRTIVPSPMNYIGGKAKLLPQLLPLFPDQINTFYDVFAGGLNVSANVQAKRVIANDLNHYVIDIARVFYSRSISEILSQIHAYIQAFGLSKTNQEGFLAFRADYNADPNPIKLYTLICYSFNYQFRFNNQHEYNNPFGKNRSQFSTRLEEKLIRFCARIKEQPLELHSQPFEDMLGNGTFNSQDFVYLDPPYLITTGSYNDGNRGFKHWTPEQEELLLGCLDRLDAMGVRFALSNVTHHKGRENPLLIQWAKRYHVHSLSFDYSNSAYNTQKSPSKEVLITNY